MSTASMVSLRAKLARARGSVSHLTHTLTALERQRSQAEYLGWAALEQSFAQDIEHGEELLAEARRAQAPRAADIRGHA